MTLDDMSPETVEKMKACTSPEEMQKLAQEENLELSVDQLDAAAGGFDGIGWDDSCADPDGDERADIDPDGAREAYKRGEISYADLDW